MSSSVYFAQYRRNKLLHVPLQKNPKEQKLAPPPQTQISPICKICRSLIFLRKCTRKEIFSCVRKTRSLNRNRIFFTIFGAFWLVVPARLPSTTRKKPLSFALHAVKFSALLIYGPRESVSVSPVTLCLRKIARALWLQKIFWRNFKNSKKKGGPPPPTRQPTQVF